MGNKTPSRKTTRAVTRLKPELVATANMSKGDSTAADVISDVAAEEGLSRHTGMMLLDVIGNHLIGKTVWLETPNWVYVGIVDEIGRDYFKLRRVARMISDGRHHVMMRDGAVAEGMELEPSGGPSREMYFPIDWLGPICEWPHDIPNDAI